MAADGPSNPSLEQLSFSLEFRLKFRPLKILGEGGMGFVMLAEQLGLGRRVAIKFLNAVISGEHDFRRRFIREASCAGKLNHANIVQAFDFSQDGDFYFIVFEVVDGGDLRTYTRRAPLPPRDVLGLVRQVGAGLAFAHDCGIVHRDIKPQNILLTQDLVPKIADFGLALAAEARDRLTGTGQMLGTPSYMAPEQVLGHGVGPAADLYALGVVTFELLSGRRPHQGTDPAAILRAKLTEPAPHLRSVAPMAPTALAAVVDQALQRRPEDRQASVARFVEDFEQAMYPELDEDQEPLETVVGSRPVALLRPPPDDAPTERLEPGATLTAASRALPAASREAKRPGSRATPQPTLHGGAPPRTPPAAAFSRRTALLVGVAALLAGAGAVTLLAPAPTRRPPAATPLPTNRLPDGLALSADEAERLGRELADGAFLEDQDCSLVRGLAAERLAERHAKVAERLPDEVDRHEGGTSERFAQLQEQIRFAMDQASQAAHNATTGLETHFQHLLACDELRSLQRRRSSLERCLAAPPPDLTTWDLRTLYEGLAPLLLHQALAAHRRPALLFVPDVRGLLAASGLYEVVSDDVAARCRGGRPLPTSFVDSRLEAANLVVMDAFYDGPAPTWSQAFSRRAAGDRSLANARDIIDPIVHSVAVQIYDEQRPSHPPSRTSVVDLGALGGWPGRHVGVRVAFEELGPGLYLKVTFQPLVPGLLRSPAFYLAGALLPGGGLKGEALLVVNRDLVSAGPNACRLFVGRLDGGQGRATVRLASVGVYLLD